MALQVRNWAKNKIKRIRAEVEPWPFASQTGTLTTNPARQTAENCFCTVVVVVVITELAL